MSTEVTVAGSQVAVRSWGGTARGMVVTMQVTRTEWEATKTWMCEVEGEETCWSAREVVEQWVRDGATVVWKTPAQWRAEARACRAHRWASMVETHAVRCEWAADQATKEQVRAV